MSHANLISWPVKLDYSALKDNGLEALTLTEWLKYNKRLLLL